MTQVYVLCEGQTEESFVNELLFPLFFAKGIILCPIVCKTKRELSGKKHKGGVSTYGKIRKELSILFRSHPHEYVTMMFDYYQLPHDTPGTADVPNGSVTDKAKYLEERIARDIGAANLIPNIVMHEFEGLLFSQPEAFFYCGLSDEKINSLHKIRSDCESPEHINDGITTAPSKRVLSVYPAYNKVLDGIIIACDVGIHKIREECPHFNNWLQKIATLQK